MDNDATFETVRAWKVNGIEYTDFAEAQAAYREAIKNDWYYSDPIIVKIEGVVPRLEIVDWLKKNGHKIPKEYLEKPE